MGLGWRHLWRDVRAGELRLLILSVTLAVAALTAVGFFAFWLMIACSRTMPKMLNLTEGLACD